MLSLGYHWRKILSEAKCLEKRTYRYFKSTYPTAAIVCNLSIPCQADATPPSDTADIRTQPLPLNHQRHQLFISLITSCAMSEITSYQYRLLESKRHIRLLKLSSIRKLLYRWKLLPSALGIPTLPKVEIKHISVDDDIEFETVSYAWGDSAGVGRLLISGTDQHIALTQSLVDALPQLIKECRTGVLWIDQICINQRDVQEREQQVAMMGDVFENSKRTLVWLDLGDETSRLAAKCIKYLHYVIPEGHSCDHHVRSNAIYNLWERGHWPFSDHEYVNMIKSFRKCAWLSRAWVIQEFILAQSVTFIWGSRTFSTQAIDDLKTGFPDSMLKATQESQWSDLNNFIALQAGRLQFMKYRREDRWMGLLQVMFETSGSFDTTIDRDGLFSQLGLWKPPSFEPSYTEPLPNILINLPGALLKTLDPWIF